MSPDCFVYNEKVVPRCASNSIFMIVPCPDRMSETVEIRTNFLHNLIANAIAEADTTQQIHFYNITCTHPWFKQASGYVFQKFVTAWLFSDPESRGLQCTPTDSETTDLFVLNPIGVTLFIFGKEGALLKVQDHTISGWLSAAPNYPSFDAIIFTPNHIITLQATIASTHNTKLLGFELVEKVYKPNNCYQSGHTWCHVFLTHCEGNAERLRAQAFPKLEKKNIGIYSAVLNPAQLGMTPEVVQHAQTRRVCTDFIHIGIT
jgi:hypothetical protein